MDCPGTTAEDCQNAFNQVGLTGLGFDECVSVCADGKNPNGIQHIPDPELKGAFLSRRVLCTLTWSTFRGFHI